MMRVQKFLSRAGYCSRREGERLMRQGRVKINGEVCRELGTKVEPATDEVEVDGRTIVLPEAFSYVLMNKPEGHVTTLDDPRGRPTVVELLPDDTPRLWPVGRLDRDSSGLLLMTNDGELTHRLTHPSFEARKHYRVVVRGRPGEGALNRLREGVRLDNDYVTEPAEVEVVDEREDSTVVRMTLTEGKNRQIRRMADKVGHPVRSLRRIGLGPLGLDGLEEGETRRLSEDEVDRLYAEVGLDPSQRKADGETSDG